MNIFSPGLFYCWKYNLTFTTITTMTDRKKTNRNIWVSIGAAVLIILLLVWLFVAFLGGDTDVAAFIPARFPL